MILQLLWILDLFGNCLATPCADLYGMPCLKPMECCDERYSTKYMYCQFNTARQAYLHTGLYNCPKGQYCRPRQAKDQSDYCDDLSNRPKNVPIFSINARH